MNLKSLLSRFALVSLIFPVFSNAASASDRLPDLVITDVTAARGLRLADGTHLVPVTFTVRNQGLGAAGAFYVQATYRRPLSNDEPWVSLTTGGRQVLIRGLGAGESRVVRALVRGLRPETNPTTVTLHADSCIGVEFPPDGCYVRERNETNNSTLKAVYPE